MDHYLGPLFATLDLDAIPRPFAWTAFQMKFEVEVGVSAPGRDPMFSFGFEIPVADLPPAIAELLNRIIP